MTRVVHCKKEPYDVMIDRSTKWGNPFVVGRDGNRDQVIQKYATWLMDQPELLQCLHELKGRVLGCWCSPKACHGNILVKLVEERFCSE
jgi:hypothetical protein